MTHALTRSVLQMCAAAAMTAAAVSFSVTGASAGECPAGKIVADGQGQKMNPAKAKDVTDTVLNRIDLVNEPVMLKDHALRLRRLVISPAASCPGTATPTAPRSSTSSAARSPSIAARA